LVITRSYRTSLSTGSAAYLPYPPPCSSRWSSAAAPPATTGQRSCFFRAREGAGWKHDGEQVFDPNQVYGK
jgi:hypothetical protein